MNATRACVRRVAAQRRSRGVSLIEALLALVVMAVGMLAVAGVQTTLRGNGDLSRQRAEAVRLAQQSIEQHRGFVELGAGGRGYGDLVPGTSPLSADVVADRVNTAFAVRRTVTVPPDAPGTGEPSPPMKTVALRVDWTDRTAQAQAVELFTVVAKVLPEIAGSLAIPPQGSPTRWPRGRHAAIPVSATARDDGTSEFRPPQPDGSTAVRWFFDNATGFITRVCTGTGDAEVCTAVAAQLLSGYLRLALPPSVPGNPALMGASAALDPPSTVAELLALTAGVPPAATVDYTTSSGETPRSEACFIGAVGVGASAPLEYFCALPLYPLLTGAVPTWSGRLTLGPASLFATAAGDTSDARLRACRYFDLGGSGTYTAVAGPLSQQNLVLAAAGNGTAAWGCPGGPTVSVAHGTGG